MGKKRKASKPKAKAKRPPAGRAKGSGGGSARKRKVRVEPWGRAGAAGIAGGVAAGREGPAIPCSRAVGG